MPTRESKANKISVHIKSKQVLLIAAAVLLLYVIVPQLGAFHASFKALEHVRPEWVLLSIVCYLCTAPASAALYRSLALRRIPYGRTVLVQYGSSFANRLLPAGLGALGVGYFYLRKLRFTEPAAIAVVTLNNVLGFAGHIMIVVLVVLCLPTSLSTGLMHLHVNWDMMAAMVLGIVGLVTVYLVLSRRVHRLPAIAHRTLRQLAGYRQHKRRLLLALIVSICLTMLYSLALWASGQALGASFALPQAVVILAVGVGIGAAIPSPGGIGGAEAGLVAGLLAFGQSADLAIATAIVYRLVTYWLGFGVGAAAFVWCRQRRYF